MIGVAVQGIVGFFKLIGKGVWLVVKLVAVVLTFGVVAWVRHRRNKKMRDRTSNLEQREAALDERMTAMETKAEPAATAPGEPPAAEPSPPETPPVPE